MKVILYMAISVNGMIAKSDDDTNWISKEEWDNYSAIVRKAGCLIVGRRTYNILTKQPEFYEFKDVKLVVVSRKDNVKLVSSDHFIAHSPQQALNFLREFKEVIVAGGRILNHSFLIENLIDEIYLDIEPIIISNGIPIFLGNNLENNLKLIRKRKITDNVIQLHYKVLRSKKLCVYHTLKGVVCLSFLDTKNLYDF